MLINGIFAPHTLLGSEKSYRSLIELESCEKMRECQTFFPQQICLACKATQRHSKRARDDGE